VLVGAGGGVAVIASTTGTDMHAPVHTDLFTRLTWASEYHASLGNGGCRWRHRRRIFWPLRLQLRETNPYWQRRCE